MVGIAPRIDELLRMIVRLILKGCDTLCDILLCQCYAAFNGDAVFPFFIGLRDERHVLLIFFPVYGHDCGVLKAHCLGPLDRQL